MKRKMGVLQVRVQTEKKEKVMTSDQMKTKVNSVLGMEKSETIEKRRKARQALQIRNRLSAQGDRKLIKLKLR